MKRFLLVTWITILFLPLFSQTTDVVTKKEFQDTKKKLTENIDQAKKTGTEAKRIVSQHATLLDSLKMIITESQAMVKATQDSLALAKTKINTLQENLDRNKLNSRNWILITLVVFGVLFIISFVLIFMMKNRADKKGVELEEKSGRLESDMNGLKDVNKLEHEKISLMADDLKKKLTEALEKEELRNKALSVRIEDLLKSLDEKSQALVASIDDLKNEHGKKLLQHDDRVKAMGSEVDSKIKEVEKRVLPVVEKQHEVSSALANEIKNFKYSVEKEIKKISEEFAAHVHSK